MVSISSGQLVKLRTPLEGIGPIDKHVVRAIIDRDEAVLVLRKDYPDQSFFELPGGKVEINPKVKRTKHGVVWAEEPHEALEREILEEIGVDNRMRGIRAYVGSIDYVSREGRTARQSFFHVDMVDPVRITLSEHEGSMWLPRGEVPRPDLKEKSAVGVREFWNAYASLRT